MSTTDTTTETAGPGPAPDRCITCEELELARVRDARPSQTLPLPAAALAGLPGGRTSGDITRRRLLAGGIAGFASVYGSRLLGFEEIFEAAVAEAAAPAQNCLVMLYLAGGNCSLNTVLPGTGAGADYAAYTTARAAIHRQHGASGAVVGSQDIPGAGGALAWANPVVSSGGGGDNGSPTYGLDQLYGDGTAANSRLAFLPAVDYTPSNFSHFDSADYWFAGGLTAMTTGWLGRWIDQNGSATNPLQAISVDTALSKAIRTSVNPVCAIPSTSALGFSMNAVGGYGMPPYPPGPSAADINAQMAALGALQAGASNAYLRRSRATYGLATDVAAAGPTINSQTAPTVTYPFGDLGDKLKLTAQLLAANLGTRIVTVHWGGFDTHGGQVTTQDPQLKTLSVALGAFQADLAARGLDQNVSTLVFSEFGRRVQENASGGTDHGAGGLMMLAGSRVRGGWAGEFPGCKPADLDPTGNLKVTTDFRSVYQSILTEWLGGDTSGLLPGSPFLPGVNRHDGQGNTLFQ
ncbi:MAG: hypothetical protein JWO02_1063 [Solirubrobacterales bacterium]|nr:hypothetical protein [Solirubrobacterales bacterium]